MQPHTLEHNTSPGTESVSGSKGVKLMYEDKNIQETLSQLKSDQRNGLTEAEAQTRLRQNGKNELEESKRKTAAESFLEQLNDPLICILLAAAAISFFLHELSDAVIILTVIIMNSVIGVIQEGKAQKALESLKRLTSPRAVVRRNGNQMEIPSSDLAVGDIVCLDTGRQVPADLRLLETVNLKIEESALTGESLPITKDAGFLAKKKLSLGDRKNMAFMSTVVTFGRGEGVVTATGMNTEIGKIASIINDAPKELTPLQKRLADLGKILSIVSVLLCASLLGIAILQKRDIIEMLITAISLAVAAVPEGLPAIVTIVLALSVSKMVKVHTIVRRLPSVETLGAVSIVCSDKTGTLTQNKMTVTKCYVNQQSLDCDKLKPEDCREFLEGITLCNNAVVSRHTILGDPTEAALLYLSGRYNITKETLEKRKPRVKELPFDSGRKMMSTLHKTGGNYVSYTKGAADILVKGCSHILVKGRQIPITDSHKRQILSAAADMSSQALRVLAVAMRTGTDSLRETGLTFVGLAGMMDPARPEAAEAVKKFRRASVTTVMITGDHVDTAFAIARQLGIAAQMDECMTGDELQRISDAELKKRLPGLHVFARVSPEHKVRIVKAYKESGNIVAMTGDGVNDAPSLKTADIGIAMGQTGTDVAKNASDMILTDDNFATIEKAIEEGRGIYENIKKSVLFLLSSNFGEIITMFIPVLMGLASPLKASHILWINLITDSLPALALGVDENHKESLMKSPPRRARESLFAGGGVAFTLFYGLLIAGISLTAFLKIPCDILSEQGMPWNLGNIIAVLQTGSVLDHAQTHAFTVLGLSQLFHAIGMRDIHRSVFQMDHLKNKLMLAALAVGFTLQIAVTEIPYLIHAFGTTALATGEWLRLIVLAAFPLIAHELFILTSFDFAGKSAKKKEARTLYE